MHIIPYKNWLNLDLKCVTIERYMNKFMLEALKEAEKAEAMGEVPIGAIVEKDGQIVGRGHNETESAKDPTAHAEMMAIKQAATHLGGWRLTGCSMYVTIEPCAMCAGALVWSRMSNLYIGAKDLKSGACGSVMNIVDDHKLNHRINVKTGIMEDECSKIMKRFFINLRNTERNKSEEQKT